MENQTDENLPNPENKFKDFEIFFGSQERAKVCLRQVLEKVEFPQFVFHVTQQRSIETRRSDSAEAKYFSFSVMAFYALTMLEHRFLQRLRFPGLKMVDESVYQPVFFITDYQKAKESQNFIEKPGLETGHEIEVQMPFSELSQNSLIIDSADRFKDLIDYFSQSTPGSEHKDLAIKALNYRLEDWQEVEQLRQEKIEGH